MTRQRQKEEEKAFVKRAGDLLGENWNILEPPDEHEWPDLLVETDTGSFGIEVRKLYTDESTKGSPNRTAESLRIQQLNKVAALYYKNGSPAIRVQFYGNPENPTGLANDLASTVYSMKIWEQKKITYNCQQRMYVTRLPIEFGKYTRWIIVSDRVGFVGVIESSIVQRVIHEKSENLERYQAHIKDIRLLLVSDRTFNSGKNSFSNIDKLKTEGFDHVYLLSFPDELSQIPAKTKCSRI